MKQKKMTLDRGIRAIDPEDVHTLFPGSGSPRITLLDLESIQKNNIIKIINIMLFLGVC